MLARIFVPCWRAANATISAKAETLNTNEPVSDPERLGSDAGDEAWMPWFHAAWAYRAITVSSPLLRGSPILNSALVPAVRWPSHG